MAMTGSGRRGGPIGEMNLTPMIDVLLVLLIIFMVVQQGLLRSSVLHVPPPPGVAAPRIEAEDKLVLRVEAGGRYRLNNLLIPADRLEATLAEVFAPRHRKVLFVDGAESLPYGEVIAAVDASRAAGVRLVGLVPLDAAR